MDNGFSVKVFGKYCGFYNTEEQAKAVHVCLFKQKFQDLIDKYASLLENKAINALESIMEEIK